jgi:hypothetical protein
MQHDGMHTVSQILITECDGVYEVRGYDDDGLSILENAGSVRLDGTKINLEPNGDMMILTPNEGSAWFFIEDDRRVEITRSF